MSGLQRTGIAVLLTLLAILGIYRFGFSKGWEKRDVEMQAEIAKRNEESRAQEQAQHRSSRRHQPSYRRPTMPWIKNLLPLIALSALAGCASPPQVAYKPPQIPPLPAEIGKKREANLTDRLTKLLIPTEQPSPQSHKSSPMATEPSISSTPASTRTTK